MTNDHLAARFFLYVQKRLNLLAAVADGFFQKNVVSEFERGYALADVFAIVSGDDERVGAFYFKELVFVRKNRVVRKSEHLLRVYLLNGIEIANRYDFELFGAMYHKVAVRLTSSAETYDRNGKYFLHFLCSFNFVTIIIRRKAAPRLPFYTSFYSRI